MDFVISDPATSRSDETAETAKTAENNMNFVISDPATSRSEETGDRLTAQNNVDFLCGLSGLCGSFLIVITW
jgi:hypothetical protein